MRRRSLAGALVLLAWAVTPVHAPAPAHPVAVAQRVDDLHLLRQAQARASRDERRRSIILERRRSRVRRVDLPAARAVSLASLVASWARRPFSILVANCESGGSRQGRRYDGDPYNRHNPGYRGKWQFGWATWRSVGGTGDPADAPEAEQDRRAWLLWKRDGWSPWECASLVS